MKHLIKAALLGGAFVSANAFASGAGVTSSDVLVFVTDTSNGTFYVADTGVTLSSLLSTGSIQAAEIANGGPVADTTLLGAPTATQLQTANLASFVTTAEAANQNLTWAIMSGGAYATPASGNDQLLFTSANTVANIFGNAATITGSNLHTALSTATSGYNGWIATMNGAAAGFTNNVSSLQGFGSSSTAGQKAEQAFISTLFPTGTAVGSSQTLFEMAGSAGGSTGTPNVFAANDTITLNANGTFTVTPLGSAVPLPAAAWLLGSGLLGLLGVGRRRRAA